ncbi:MAG: FxDxF family PEP-CTERM protein [Methyloversatilis discipulorum]|uniref:FxDxF family PEP-CTERM protein n=1 Tax=Methyloversatilis discipulorum TaxID=1119528 RepID=UPI0026F22B22|nr:FxDxF family PEP-CTERM protein [Methyloversatilis discipulorum]MBV5287380.1 FxDxF family PEP-CTERM protein [Methyloversatilis discipulorum]
MFKTKLMLAIAALGMSAVASADIGGSTANGEFVFSAFDRDSGVGYTYELDDAGFNSLFGSDVRMNSLIGSTNTTSAVGFTVTQNAAGGVIFDYALPSFTDFLSGAVPANVVWNVTSIDTSGLRRLVQTVNAVPAATPYTNAALNASAAKLNEYFGAVNGKIEGADDGYALTVEADSSAYAGFNGRNFGGQGYDSFGSLDASLNMFVFGGTSSSSSSSAASLMGQIQDANGMDVLAKVYMGQDGMYHLQITAVPEPSTYAMLLAGLGLLGFAARRARG